MLATPIILCAAQAESRVNPDAQLIFEFQKRIDEYIRLLKSVDSKLPEVPAGAPYEEVDAHQRTLQRALADSRGRIKQGAIFTQPTRAYFRRQIGRALSGPDARAVREEIREANPGRVSLQVNGRYPDSLPVATMPPQILAMLPKLPPELEYRFIGDRLILLDIHSQLIVDYMDSAIP